MIFHTYILVFLCFESIHAYFTSCNSMKNGSLLSPFDTNLRCSLYYDIRIPVKCRKENSRRTYEFKVVQELPKEGNVTRFCIGLNKLFVNNTSSDVNGALLYSLSFQYSTPVGVIETNDSSTIKSWIVSTFYLLSGIADSPPLRKSPDETTFWNFTASHWKEKKNWFQSLHSDGYVFTWDKFISLNNTSIVDLSFVWHNVTTKRFSKETESVNISDVTLPLLSSLTIQNDSLNNPLLLNFGNTKNLRKLDLSENNMSEFPPSIATLSNLKELQLSSNEEISLTKQSQFTKIIQNLEALEIMNLSSTPIGNITVHIPLQRLKFLNLSRCSIETIIDDAFNNTPILMSIDLSHNSLRYINIKFPKKLRILFLNHNKIHSMFASTKYSTQVEIVSLAFNNFSSWPHLRRTNLRNLDMTGNFLTDIAHYDNVAVLNLKLRQNLISNWTSPRTFSWVSRQLNLSDNRISVLTKDMVKSLSQLSILDLAENPFDCDDCRIRNLQALLHSSSPREIRQPTCGFPASERGRLVRYAVCVTPPFDYLLFVVAPVGSVVVFCLLVTTVLCACRSKISYMWHLRSIRSESGSMTLSVIYDVFICYGSKERSFVLRELAPQLQKGSERYRVCLHDRDFLVGCKSTRNVVNLITRSRRTLVVLSPNFINTKWSSWEEEMAKHNILNGPHKSLILLSREVLDHTNLPQSLKHLMEHRPYLEWRRGGDDASKLQAVRGLRQALGRSLFMRRMTAGRRGGRGKMPSIHEAAPEGSAAGVGLPGEATDRTPLMAGVAYRV